MTKRLLPLASILIIPAALMAQDAAATASSAPSAPKPDAMTAGAKGLYSLIKGNIMKAAEKMPEENYSFKPSPDVRTFGELVGHIAGAEMYFCSLVSGQQMPTPPDKDKKMAKADLMKMLSDASTLCDSTYNNMTDAKGAETVKFMGGDQPKLAVLYFNGAHMYEHYGNMSTYMRIKGLVPPSSEK